MAVEAVDAQPVARRIDKLPGLEALRFFAAAPIIVFHTTLIPHLKVPTILGFIPTHFGNGVPLFYAVSAFGLFYGYGERLRSGKDVRDFYLRRFLRIAPLFYFMMAFYIAFLWAMYGAIVPLDKIATSALFIFNLIPSHVEGYVWASWSIGVEMLFYAIMPLLALKIRSTFAAGVFFALAAMLAALWRIGFTDATGVLASFAGFSLAAHLVFFAGGIVALYVFVGLERFKESDRLLIGSALLAASSVAIVAMVAFSQQLALLLYFAVGPLLSAPVIRTLWAVALSMLILGIALRPVVLLVNPVTRALGRASFSLYLWHPVVVVVLNRLGVYGWMYTIIKSTTLALLGSIGVTFAVVIPLALISYAMIERPGMNIHRRFLKPSAVQARA